MRGWIITLLAVVAAVVAVGVAAIVVLTSSTSTSLADLDVGDCFVLPALDSAAEGALGELVPVDVIGCDEPHDAEVVAVGELDPAGDRPYPDDVALLAETDARCQGVDVDRARFGVLPVAPDEGTWTSFRGRFACLAIPFGGALVSERAVRPAA